MEFRWIAGITLWTMLSGPVLIHWSTIIPRPQAQPPMVEREAPRAVEPEEITPVAFVEGGF